MCTFVFTYICIYKYMHAYACVCIRYTQHSFLRVLVSVSAAAMHDASRIGRCEPFGNDSGTIWKPFGRGEAKLKRLRMRRLQTHGKNSPMKNEGLFSADVT